MPQNFGTCQTCGKSVVDLLAKLAQLERTIQWAADRLRHDGNKEAVVVEVIDQLNKAVQ